MHLTLLLTHRIPPQMHRIPPQTHRIPHQMRRILPQVLHRTLPPGEYQFILRAVHPTLALVLLRMAEVTPTEGRMEDPVDSPILDMARRYHRMLDLVQLLQRYVIKV